MKIILTDADGVIEEREVSLHWLANYVRQLVRTKTAFTIVTKGGKLRYDRANEENSL